MPFVFGWILILSAVVGMSVAVAATSADVKPAATAVPIAPAAPSGVAASPSPPTKADVKSVSVTRVVGEAGSRIVTSREVRMNDAIAQVLFPSGTAAEKRILAIDDAAFPMHVLRVLDEWTVYLEAVVIGSKTADKSEVARFVKLVTDSWKGSAEWEKLEASPNEIREIVERKLAAQSLELLKADSSLVNVSDAEALQYFKKNRLRFGNLPFESFKDGIKSALVRNQTERRLGEWRTVLRKKYRVRNFVGA